MNSRTAREERGFTLIEVMIVVAIVGILAAIAYPNYQQYVQRSRRADCAGVLTTLAGAMERRYSTTNTYLPQTLPAGFQATCPADGGTATYNLAVSAATATSFTLTATPTGSQTGDPCGALSLTNTGLKSSAQLTTNECWR